MTATHIPVLPASSITTQQQAAQPMLDSAIESYGDVSVSANGAYQVGVKQRNAGAVVRRAVFVNCELFDGEKKSTTSFALHEIPLLRKRIERRTGSVVIDPIWVPGLSRLRGLTEGEVRAEQERLIEQFQLQSGDSSFNCFHAVYGGNDRACTFFEKMSDLTREWGAMCGRVRVAGLKISRESIEEVLERVFPASRIEADFITPDDLAEDVETAGTGGAVGLEHELQAAGIPPETAAGFARVHAAKLGDPLEADDWAQVPGCEPAVKGAAKKRRELLRLVAEITGAPMAGQPAAQEEPGD